MNKTAYSTIAASLFLITSAASAATPNMVADGSMGGASNQHQSFSKLDKNGDGLINATEAKADKTLAKDFSKIAQNGVIDEPTYVAWSQSTSQPGTSGG